MLRVALGILGAGMVHPGRVGVILGAPDSDTGKPQAALSAPAPARAAAAVAPAPAQGGANRLRLDFQQAPAGAVLDYLSVAAGLVVVQEVEVLGNVDVRSNGPVGVDEAVELLRTALRQRGYDAARHGRLLTISRLTEPRYLDAPVVRGNDPDAVEKSAEVVTQIVPVRNLSAGRLLENLRPFLATSAGASVNESANALILVAAKKDVRRALQIAAALDSAPTKLVEVRIFQFHYADARQLATVVQQVFGSETSSQSGGGPDQGGPAGGGPPDAPRPPGEFAAAAGSRAAQSAGNLTAVADDTSNSLIVSAPPARFARVAALLEQLDRPTTDITEIRTFRLLNADPSELADELAALFPNSAASADQQLPPLQVGGPPDFGPGQDGGPPGTDGAATESQPANSERALKKSQVLAIPDARTSTLVVSAPSTLFPQISKLIAGLDASPAGKEKIHVYELRGADPQDVNSILQDLLNRNLTARNNNSRSPLLGQNHPLTTRATQQQSSTQTQGFTLGTSGGAGGGEGGGGSGGGGR